MTTYNKMKMKSITLIFSIAFVMPPSAGQAQIFKKLGDRMANKVANRAGQKADMTMDKAIDEAEKTFR